MASSRPWRATVRRDSPATRGRRTNATLRQPRMWRWTRPATLYRRLRQQPRTHGGERSDHDQRGQRHARPSAATAGPATNAGLAAPQRMAFDGADNLYLVDGPRVRKIAGGVIATVAGGGAPSGEGGPAASCAARFAAGRGSGRRGQCVHHRCGHGTRARSHRWHDTETGGHRNGRIQRRQRSGGERAAGGALGRRGGFGGQYLS